MRKYSPKIDLGGGIAKLARDAESPVAQQVRTCVPSSVFARLCSSQSLRSAQEFANEPSGLQVGGQMLVAET
jgi:hypothetical protein